jgi:hypothetical protein
VADAYVQAIRLKAFAPVAMQVSNIRFQMGRHRSRKTGRCRRLESACGQKGRPRLNKSTFIQAACAVLPLLSASTATAAASSQPARRAAAAPSYSVSGISIGMTVEQVKAAARSGNLQVSDSTPTETFAQAVDLAQHRPVALQSGIRTLTLTNGIGNRVFVKFTQFPDGGRVSYLRFTVPKASYTPDEAVAEMTKRYGKLTDAIRAPMVSGLLTRWCAPSPKCSSATPSLNVYADAVDTAIQLDSGDAMTNRAAAALKAAIAASPAAKRAAF